MAGVTEYRSCVVDPAPPVDARSDRAAEGFVGIALLAGFVFRWPWLVPLLALVLGAGAAFGPGANVLHLGFSALIARRLPPADRWVPAETVRAQDAFLAGLCAAGAISLALGLTPIGWLLVIAAALIAIFAASTRLYLGERVIGRFLR